MTAPGAIGILGATGAVGAAVVRELARPGGRPLRLGGRRTDGLRAIAAGLEGVEVEARSADAFDPDGLRAFCAGCALVVNAAAPSHVILDRVAVAAARAGAHYVDPGGDAALMRRLDGETLKAQKRTAVLTAGMMPGLSSLLPRWLAAGMVPERLTAYVGTLDRLTAGSAADYLLSLGDGHGRPNAAWVGGAPATGALEPLVDRALPFFDGTVTAHPFLSREAERLATDLGLADVRWYNVFDGGAHLLTALGRHRAATADGSELSAAVEDIIAAAGLDLFGREPYQLMVFELRGRRGRQPLARSLRLRASSTYPLTAAVTAQAVRAVLEGGVPPGAHFADQVLDPAIAAQVAGVPAVTAFDVFESELDAAADVCEGAL